MVPMPLDIVAFWMVCNPRGGVILSCYHTHLPMEPAPQNAATTPLPLSHIF